MVSESVKLLSSAKGVSKLRSQPTKATTSLLFYHKTAFLHILNISEWQQEEAFLKMPGNLAHLLPLCGVLL